MSIIDNKESFCKPLHKLAIFDLDGTLLDTLPDLAAAVNHALTLNSLPVRPINTIRKFIGNGVKTLIERSIYVPQNKMDEVEKDPSIDFVPVTNNYVVKDLSLFTKVHADFVEYYLSHATVYTKPYAGIAEVLSALKDKGTVLAVVTNKRDDLAHIIIEKYFPDTFELVIGDRAGHPKKPAPDSVLEVLEKLNFAPEDTIYIGDSNVDAETAANAGLSCIAVSWGYRSLHDLLLTSANMFAAEPHELGLLI